MLYQLTQPVAAIRLANNSAVELSAGLIVTVELADDGFIFQISDGDLFLVEA